MRANIPRTRTLGRAACVASLAALFALAGCKSKDGGGGSVGGGTGGNRDPLVYGPNRIPPQNVPLNDRAGTPAKGTRTDPLIGAPTSKSNDKSVGYTTDPDRLKGPHIPGPGSTPAALASSGSRRREGDELKIEGSDNRVPLQPAGGIVPASAETDSGVDGLYQELQQLGVKPADRSLTREDGKYVFKAAVQNLSGAKRQYNGVGDTASDAVKQVLEQLMLDRR